MIENRIKIFTCFIKLYIFLFYNITLAQHSIISNDSIASLITTAFENYELQNHKTSLDYAHAALKHAHECNDENLTAKAYNVIGLNYQEFLDTNRVIDIFTKAYVLVKNTSDYQLQFDILNNLANAYKIENPTKAIEIYNQALQLDQTKIKYVAILFCKVNIAKAYYVLKQIGKGYDLLKTVEQQILASNSNKLQLHYHLLMGNYFDFINQFSKAQTHYNIALSFLNSDDKFPQKLKHKIIIYKYLANFYEKNNMREWAYFYLQKSLAAHNELYTSDFNQAIANYASKIDDEDYKREILNIEKLNEEQKQTIFYTRIIYSLFFLIAVFLLLNVKYLIKNQKQKNKLIEEIELQNIALETAKKQAEEIADMKSQFISKVSHELRTPLYSVIGLTSILEQDYEELKQNKIVNALKFSSNYLMNLINDLLQLQKIEAKASKIEIQSYDIQSELNSIIQSLNSISLANNNQINTIFKDQVHQIIEADKVKLNQILYNLLSNALKFTKNGYITISVSQKVITNDKLELHFSISDTGIGISEDNIKKVFKKFVQFHVKGTDYQGTGLGLSIVKQLVLLLGGKIYVTSKLSLGTTFNFYIPCTFSTQNKAIVASNLINELNLNDISVLLVENNEINRLVNQRIFKNHNIKCLTADSANEAFQMLDKNLFDVILTDISMPEIDGFEMTEILRKKGIKIPIIALTAYTKEDIIEKALESGLNDVITKPFDFEVLLRCIYQNLSKK